MKEFDGVEDTLFIPLVGRIYGSKNYKDFFYDEKALSLEEYIPSKMIEENSDEYFTIASIARFYEFDEIVKEFIKTHVKPNIVCLGCGLETMYYRVNSKDALFYEVDFPEVIESRRKILGESENEILLGYDLFNYEWMEKLDKSRPTLIIACGVFQYLHHDDIIKLIKDLKSNFKEIELAFDATNKIGLQKANAYVKQTGNENAMMYFYIDSIKDFIHETDTILKERISFFKTSSKVLKKKLSLRTKFMCYFGDKLGYSKILYIKL